MKTERIEFDLERYNKGEYISLETRRGNSARIICMDRKGKDYPIIALEDTGREWEDIFCVTKTGKYNPLVDNSERDLFLVVNKQNPKNDEEYWYIVSDGKIIQTAFNLENQTDMERFELGNFFRSEEEAKRYLEKIKKILND